MEAARRVSGMAWHGAVRRLPGALRAGGAAPPELVARRALHGAARLWGGAAPPLRPLAASSPPSWVGQVRGKVNIPEKKLTRKVSRSSGPGGQSVNVADTRVQLSFKVDKADWIPKDVREKMKLLHKNRIDKTGEFTVACQVHNSQLMNYKMALQMIEEKIEEAEKALEADEKQANRLDFKDWVVEKFKREGREKELEKRAEALKDQKARTRERTRNKKIVMY